MTTFEELGLSKDALKAVAKLGYEEPTPVQEQAIPEALAGRDIIAAASTGTGKTAAFLLPLLSNLSRAGRGKRPPRVLVVTPTRELAQQIASTCIVIARATGHFCTTVYGGTPYSPQIRELRGGTDILIATPGRLNDLMKRGVADLSHVEALVLDEADRMLDMGFLPDVTTIVEALPEQRQTLLFSATIDQSIENNLSSLLKDPVMVEIAHKGETASTVEQFIIPVRHKEKLDLLKAVLDEKGHERVIVFARTKSRTEEFAEALIEAGYSAESIHSDKKQGQRRRALGNFKKGRTDILVATDVLARGIDVTGVDHVINVDLPDMAEDYVHRIGRTGRAGQAGYAISFVSPNSRKILKEIQELTKREIPVMQLETYEVDMGVLNKGGKKKQRKEYSKKAISDRARRAGKPAPKKPAGAKRERFEKSEGGKSFYERFSKHGKHGKGSKRDRDGRDEMRKERKAGKAEAKRGAHVEGDTGFAGKRKPAKPFRSKGGVGHRGKRDNGFNGSKPGKRKSFGDPVPVTGVRAFGGRRKKRS